VQFVVLTHVETIVAVALALSILLLLDMLNLVAS